MTFASFVAMSGVSPSPGVAGSRETPPPSRRDPPPARARDAPPRRRFPPRGAPRRLPATKTPARPPAPPPPLPASRRPPPPRAALPLRARVSVPPPSPHHPRGPPRHRPQRSSALLDLPLSVFLALRHGQLLFAAAIAVGLRRDLNPLHKLGVSLSLSGASLVALAAVLARPNSDPERSSASASSRSRNSSRRRSLPSRASSSSTPRDTPTRLPRPSSASRVP